MEKALDIIIALYLAFSFLFTTTCFISLGLNYLERRFKWKLSLH